MYAVHVEQMSFCKFEVCSTWLWVVLHSISHFPKLATFHPPQNEPQNLECTF